MSPSMHVCLKHTYIHTYIHAYAESATNAINNQRNKHVCMSENSLPVIENQTYTLKDTLSNFLRKSKTSDLRAAPKHVCMFQKPSACHGE